jgi:hypothetical protein
VAHISIHIPDQSAHIHAQRELAFEMISAMGTGGTGDENPIATVLKQETHRMLVEFNNPLKIGPISTNWKTTEWVSPYMPSAIDFELVPASGILTGGLRELIDRFEFTQQGNCTVLTYKSQFGIRWSVGGWLLGKTVIAPIIKSHMIEHLDEVKEMVENRAKRSRVYPQLACSEVSA